MSCKADGLSGRDKGITGSQMVVRTAPDSAACGYFFEIGHEYLVYASGESESLGTSICQRTMPIEWANDDLIALGPPLVISADESSWGTLKAWYKGD